MRTVITAERVLVSTAGGSRIASPGYVRIEDGRIAEAGEGDPGGPAVHSLDDGILVPGLIDLQVNGYYGHDFADADGAAWREITGRLPETGVTALVPTFITAPVSVLAGQLRRARDLLDGVNGTGARVLGFHVEGPFLSERKRGAHNARWLADPDPDSVLELLDAAGGRLRIFTLAPERTGAPAAIKALAGAGVVVSVGHSDASAATVGEAAAAGARMVTHLFNGQSGVDHREPGVATRALIDDRLTAGLIADGAHVAAEACLLAFKAAPGRIVLVTDAAAAAGMPPGRYDLGGEPIDLPEAGPPLRADGTLAGSALGLDDAVANAVRFGIDLVAAVDAATRIPADLVGESGLGRIVPGATADLVWLGPDFRTRATWIGGELAFSRFPGGGEV